MSGLIALARAPRAGAAVVLAEGRLLTAIALVAVSTALAAYGAARFASEVRVQDLVFGPGRSPAVGLLIDAIGVPLASTVVFLVERSFNALVIATAFTPVFIWLLGASAVHAAARLARTRKPFLPLLVVFGYATALTRVPADLAGALLGTGGGVGPQVAQFAGLLALLWLCVIVWRAIGVHYGVPESRAFVILAVGIVLFYLVPLVLIAAAAFAIIVAAIVLAF